MRTCLQAEHHLDESLDWSPLNVQRKALALFIRQPCLIDLQENYIFLIYLILICHVIAEDVNDGSLTFVLFCLYDLLDMNLNIHDYMAHVWTRAHQDSHILHFMGCSGEKRHYVLVQLSIITFPSNRLARQILDTKIFPTIYVTNSCLNTIIKQWKLM